MTLKTALIVPTIITALASAGLAQARDDAGFRGAQAFVNAAAQETRDLVAAREARIAEDVARAMAETHAAERQRSPKDAAHDSDRTKRPERLLASAVVAEGGYANADTRVTVEVAKQ